MNEWINQYNNYDCLQVSGKSDARMDNYRASICLKRISINSINM